MFLYKVYVIFFKFGTIVCVFLLLYKIVLLDVCLNLICCAAKPIKNNDYVNKVNVIK